jgi:hypothetical protein
MCVLFVKMKEGSDLHFGALYEYKKHRKSKNAQKIQVSTPNTTGTVKQE